MTISSRKGIIITLVVCIVLAGGALVYLRVNPGMQDVSPDQKDSPTDTSFSDQSLESAVTADASSDAAPGANASSTKSTSGKVPYDQAVKEYQKNGFRFQIVKCSATPGKLNMKQGTKFMVDNRDSKSHTFKLASVSRVIAGYDYEIFTAPKYGTYKLTCDGGGSADISVYP